MDSECKLMHVILKKKIPAGQIQAEIKEKTFWDSNTHFGRL